MNTALSNACAGRPASRNGLNMNEFRIALKQEFPHAIALIDDATGRKDLETLCNSLVANRALPTSAQTPSQTQAYVVAPTLKTDSRAKTSLKELPKIYCEDYTLVELMDKTGNNKKLTSADREEVCRTLNLPLYQTKQTESLGYPRDVILKISEKIATGVKLNMEDERVVNQWNMNHAPLKDKLDTLSKKFVSGEELSPTEMEILDRELFNKYCRCVLKRKMQDKQLIATQDLDRIYARLNPEGKEKAKQIIEGESRLIGKAWTELSGNERATILEKILPKFLDLAIGGCKSSVYMKSRGIKSRNRSCDYDMNNAEILFESLNK